MHIVAIGGGEVRELETLDIDRHVVDLTGKSNPRLLLVPTASGDSQTYLESTTAAYGNALGCRIEQLLLLSEHRDPAVIAERIQSADIIYVGGGNTLRMMKIWRRYGVVDMLEKAGRSGTILTGLSAGAICWHEWGHSDSRKFAGKDGWEFIRVRGAGFCPGFYCPHLDAEQRHEPFSRKVLKHRMSGYGCDNQAAVWYSPDGSAKVVTSRKSARCVHYAVEQGKLSCTVYQNGDSLPPLA